MVKVRIAASLAVLAVGALVMLAVAIPTLGLARRLYAEVIGRAIGIAVLGVWGIRHRVLRDAPIPAGQVVYVSNHPSSLDVFILIALGLPRTRYFLSGFLRKLPPLFVIGYLIRMFWTVPQEFPERRRRIFARADRILRRSGDSVYLSPEGTRVATGSIGPFNKGAFHLATSLGAPIVPLYLRIPREVDPGMGYVPGAGTVDVHVLPAIDTSAWTLADLERNRDRVRELFVRVHEHVKATGSLPHDLAVGVVAGSAVHAGAAT